MVILLSLWLSLIMALSPSYTWMVTAGKLTLAVSIPRDRSVASRSRRSTTASEVSPERMAAFSVAIGHSLITVEMDLFLAIKEFRVKLLYIEDPGIASREDDVIDDRLKGQGPCSTRNLIMDKLLQEAAQ